MGSARPASDEHRYQTCRDEGCERFLCRVYKEGQRDGYERGYLRGHAHGYAKGYDEGYRAGYAEGVNSCPRPHK